MPAQVTAAGQRMRSLLAGFTAGQRAVTGIALVALLLGGFAFLSWSGKTAMAPLFTDLASQDAAALTEELTARGTPYELADGGRTVMVPRPDVYQLRIDMSAAGLPSTGKTGYALLDEQGITTSEFRQRVDYQRALEGELASTIGAIDGVEAATVHLVIPEENLFSDDARKPSASVLVKTQPGASLAAGQVQAVVHLVSSSVEGLDATQVTVADASGAMLAAPGQEGATAAAGDARASQTRAYEGELSRSITSMLSQVVGAGKAVVQVSADLDFDKRETLTERFENGPEGAEAPVTSETKATEKYTGAGGVPVGGILGPENSVAVGGTADSNYDKSQTSSEYAVGKVTETAVSAPGAVERLSVAVLVDAKAASVVRGGEIERLVRAAAGMDAERGDVVNVSAMPFDTSAQDAAAEEFARLEAVKKRESLMSTGRTVLVVVVALLLGFLGLRSLRKDRRTPVELPQVEVGIPRPSLALDDQLELAGDTRRAIEPALDAADLHRIAVRDEIGELVERQPDEVAQLLRGWLADRRS